MSITVHIAPDFVTRGATVCIDPVKKRILLYYKPPSKEHTLSFSGCIIAGESPADAALRVTKAHSGYECTLIAHKGHTSVKGYGQESDHTEPIAMSVMSGGCAYWFVVKADSSSKPIGKGQGKDGIIEICWFGFESVKEIFKGTGQGRIVDKALEAAAEILAATPEQTSVKDEAGSEDGVVV